MTSRPKAAVTAKDLRVFGLGFAVVLSVFSSLAWRKHSPALPYLLGAAGAFAAAGALLPSVLRPLYGPWMRLAKLLGAVNAFIVTAFVYYAVLTPYAVVARLLGKDLLDQALRTGDSYWKLRQPRTDPASCERQF